MTGEVVKLLRCNGCKETFRSPEVKDATDAIECPGCRETHMWMFYIHLDVPADQVVHYGVDLAAPGGDKTVMVSTMDTIMGESELKRLYMAGARKTWNVVTQAWEDDPVH